MCAFTAYFLNECAVLGLLSFAFFHLLFFFYLFFLPLHFLSSFSVMNFRDAASLRLLGFDAHSLRLAGFSDISIVTAGYTATELRNANFSTEQLRAAGLNESALRVVGYQVEQQVKITVPYWYFVSCFLIQLLSSFSPSPSRMCWLHCTEPPKVPSGPLQLAGGTCCACAGAIYTPPPPSATVVLRSGVRPPWPSSCRLSSHRPLCSR